MLANAHTGYIYNWHLYTGILDNDNTVYSIHLPMQNMFTFQEEMNRSVVVKWG